MGRFDGVGWRSDALEREWHARQAAMPPLPSSAATVERETGDIQCSAVALQLSKAYQMSKRFKPPSEPQVHAAAAAELPPLPGLTRPMAMDGTSARPSRTCAARAAHLAGKTTYTNALGGVTPEPKAYRTALLELPPTLPMPAHTASAICSSLTPVLDALMSGIDVKSADFQAARNAYASWGETSWVDPRTSSADVASTGPLAAGGGGQVRSKPAKGWPC